MSIKLMFEIGHAASRKTKPSKEGFTHDWELFVRGHEGSDIGHFVEKVAFNLHESFPKPKRVIKEAPYTVKEAGYAGFVLTIDIYLKNRDEPKKVTFEYDLDLQPFKVQTSEFIISAPADDFKRKCLKGGAIIVNTSGGDYKNRDSSGKSAPVPTINDLKKPSKRPEEIKPNKIFTELFGAPLKKPDPRALQNSSPNPTKLPSASSSKGAEKISSASASGGKDKGEKSKHKHSPNKDGKDGKKANDNVKPEAEKVKKDKTKDRERSDKKEKTSKRPTSPSPVWNLSTLSSTTTAARNSTNPIALPPSKNDLLKPQTTKQSSTPTPTNDSSATKKSSKKDKKSDKERERNEKKDSRAKETSSTKDSKSMSESTTTSKGSSAGVKEREVNSSKDERDKAKQKASVVATAEPKTTQIEQKKVHDKDSERKHKHKKKEKSRDNKKEKQHKNSAATPSPAKSKEQSVKYEPPSDSDVDSPPSIKQESDNSVSDTIMQKPPPEVVEKPIKKPRERTKTAEKEDKSRKRKSAKKEDRDSSASPPPPPAKQSRKDVSKSPSIQDRPSSSDSAAHHSHINNNNNDGASNDRKISNEYMTELKDLKQKITTLKNNDDLQNVVRMIAATGCYEITKSSFDFDLVQLDRGTVQRLKEFFANS